MPGRTSSTWLTRWAKLQRGLCSIEPTHSAKIALAVTYRSILEGESGRQELRLLRRPMSRYRPRHNILGLTHFWCSY